ncbi:uncharacterized protein LOC119986689 [Tripterygium wilfordii]|uniref:uncharacterized protein LOC119986689 n=1 Tax=Tripterygium wilfordii TaxID=458696 RepID=UPI0018F7FA24|nr:uncharacterized protein LOC119986689 [Tripterygium wilfordii]
MAPQRFPNPSSPSKFCTMSPLIALTASLIWRTKSHNSIPSPSGSDIMSAIIKKFPREFSGNCGTALRRIFTKFATKTDFWIHGFTFFHADIMHLTMNAEATSTRVGLGTIELAALALRLLKIDPSNTNLFVTDMLFLYKTLAKAEVVRSSGNEWFWGNIDEALKSGARAPSIESRAIVAQVFMNAQRAVPSKILCEATTPTTMPPQENRVS